MKVLIGAALGDADEFRREHSFPFRQSPAGHSSVSFSRSDAIAVTLLLALAAAVRGAALWHDWANLSDDRDGYIALARNLANGHGFTSSGPGNPTAYRPPLYPLFLAGVLKCGGGPLALGVAQTILGLGTVSLTWLLARRCGMERGAVVAGGLVAVDPLLAQYTTWPMTETLFTLLSTGLLVAMQWAWSDRSGGELSEAALESRQGESRSLAASIGAGLLFGLCALCRPTIWAFAGLVAVCELVRETRRAGVRALHPLRLANRYGPAIVMALLVVAPWVVRNQATFGKPIITTTHGGYTLLLANNPYFYREEVDKPWDSIWDNAPQGRRQSDWIDEVGTAARRDLGDHSTEIELDEWMKSRARQTIRDEPGTFVRSCGVRLRRLWNIVPLSPAAGNVSRPIVLGVGAFYSVLFLAAIVGLVLRKSRSLESPRFLILLILSFSTVHSVYWSNARMRAPLMPAVSILAAALCERRRP